MVKHDYLPNGVLEERESMAEYLEEITELDNIVIEKCDTLASIGLNITLEEDTSLGKTYGTIRDLGQSRIDEWFLRDISVTDGRVTIQTAIDRRQYE